MPQPSYRGESPPTVSLPRRVVVLLAPPQGRACAVATVSPSTWKSASRPSLRASEPFGGLHLRSDQSALKPEQVAYILRDCSVRLLLTTRERFAARPCPRRMSRVAPGRRDTGLDDEHASAGPQRRYGWDAFNDLAGAPLHRVIDSDVAAIPVYLGSTASKGVVLSHRNMVTGAKSVASYRRIGPMM